MELLQQQQQREAASEAPRVPFNGIHVEMSSSPLADGDAAASAAAAFPAAGKDGGGGKRGWKVPDES